MVALQVLNDSLTSISEDFIWGWFADVQTTSYLKLYYFQELKEPKIAKNRTTCMKDPRDYKSCADCEMIPSKRSKLAN